MNRLEIFQKVYGADHVFTVQELERLRQVTELIIRECLEVCHAKTLEYSLADECAEDIKEHFGIK